MEVLYQLSYRGAGRMWTRRCSRRATRIYRRLTCGVNGVGKKGDSPQQVRAHISGDSPGTREELIECRAAESALVNDSQRRGRGQQHLPHSLPRHV